MSEESVDGCLPTRIDHQWAELLGETRYPLREPRGLGLGVRAHGPCDRVP